MAARSITVINSTPSGNELVGVHNRMGMKLASKFNGTLMVKSKLFELIKGVSNIRGPANTQKESIESQFLHYRVCRGLYAAAVPPPTVVQALCPHST
eukprot:324737-Pelagomonas_calceolata.AAC.1